MNTLEKFLIGENRWLVTVQRNSKTSYLAAHETKAEAIENAKEYAAINNDVEAIWVTKTPFILIQD